MWPDVVRRATDGGAGQAVLTKAGETVRFSTRAEEGAEYIAVCVPACSPELARRAEDAG